MTYSNFKKTTGVNQEHLRLQWKLIIAQKNCGIATEPNNWNSTNQFFPENNSISDTEKKIWPGLNPKHYVPEAAALPPDQVRWINVTLFISYEPKGKWLKWFC